jgi:MFS family permease
VAQAITVSLAWLPVVWVLGGHTVLDWTEKKTATEHQGAILLIVLLNLFGAIVAGLLGGKLIDVLASWGWVRKVLGWTGLFEPPTAWEAAWLYASQAEWAAVEISLRSGERFNVLFDKASTVGVSPAPRRAFFRVEYRYGDNQEIQFENHQGIYVDASEVVSVRFEYLAE